MSATNTTTNYGLPQFTATDKPTWQGDFNGAMDTIDAAIPKVVQTTGQSTTDVMSQNAITEALNTKQNSLIFSGENQNIATINGESLEGNKNIEINANGLNVIPATLSTTGLTTDFTNLASLQLQPGNYVIFNCVEVGNWGRPTIQPANSALIRGDIDDNVAIQGRYIDYPADSSSNDTSQTTSTIMSTLTITTASTLVIKGKVKGTDGYCYGGTVIALKTGEITE